MQIIRFYLLCRTAYPQQAMPELFPRSCDIAQLGIKHLLCKNYVLPEILIETRYIASLHCLSQRSITNYSKVILHMPSSGFDCCRPLPTKSLSYTNPTLNIPFIESCPSFPKPSILFESVMTC